MNYDLDFAEIKLQNQKLARELASIKEQIATNQVNNTLDKEYYTLEECARLKGGAAVNTYLGSRMLLPGCGSPQYVVNIAGRTCVPRKYVMEWLQVTDDNLLDYIHSCGISTVPERFIRLARKAGYKLKEA